MKAAWREGTTTEKICMIGWVLLALGFIGDIILNRGLPTASQTAILAAALVFCVAIYAQAKIARLKKQIAK